MAKTVQDQALSSSLFFFKPSLLFVAVLVHCLIFTWFFSFGFSGFLVTSSVLILSTVLLVTYTKKIVILYKNPAQDEDTIYGEENMVEMDVGAKLQPVIETAAQENAAAQKSEVGLVHDYLFGSTNLLSEIESGDDSVTSEDFELSWMCTDSVGQSPATSDGSNSDDDDQEEDSLIEIALPDKHSVNLEEEPKKKVQLNLPDFWPESSILQQHGLMELLADASEMNEEENLIEIDLSMGSIKCSRFEIEA